MDNRSYGKPISGRSIDRNVVKQLGVESKVCGYYLNVSIAHSAQAILPTLKSQLAKAKKEYGVDSSEYLELQSTIETKTLEFEYDYLSRL